MACRFESCRIHGCSMVSVFKWFKKDVSPIIQVRVKRPRCMFWRAPLVGSNPITHPRPHDSRPQWCGEDLPSAKPSWGLLSLVTYDA